MWAGAPFDKPTANVILLSSDRFSFRVRKEILAEASPVFECTFSSPQPGPTCDGGQRDGPDWKDGLPVVGVTENYETLDALLSRGCACFLNDFGGQIGPGGCDEVHDGGHSDSAEETSAGQFTR